MCWAYAWGGCHNSLLYASHAPWQGDLKILPSKLELLESCWLVGIWPTAGGRSNFKAISSPDLKLSCIPVFSETCPAAICTNMT